MARLRRESACSCDENNTAAHPTTLAELRRDDVNSTRCITLLVKLPSGTCGQTLVDDVVIREMSDHRYNTGCGLDVNRCIVENSQVVSLWRSSSVWDVSRGGVA